MPKQRITKEMVVSAAFEIARRDGMEQVLVKNIADKATVKVGIYDEVDFSASGTPKTSQCYMYTHKTEDDGYDLWIEGAITQ